MESSNNKVVIKNIPGFIDLPNFVGVLDSKNIKPSKTELVTDNFPNQNNT